METNLGQHKRVVSGSSRRSCTTCATARARTAFGAALMNTTGVGDTVTEGGLEAGGGLGTTRAVVMDEDVKLVLKGRGAFGTGTAVGVAV